MAIRYEKPRFGGVFLCPLLAESGPSLRSNFGDLNDRFREKRTFARYIEWMRDHREIFEFVDGVGHYDSGWWLNHK